LWPKALRGLREKNYGTGATSKKKWLASRKKTATAHSLHPIRLQCVGIRGVYKEVLILKIDHMGGQAKKGGINWTGVSSTGGNPYS